MMELLSVISSQPKSYIHERACRMINQLPSTIGDDLYLFRLNWLPIDYV